MCRSFNFDATANERSVFAPSEGESENRNIDVIKFKKRKLYTCAGFLRSSSHSLLRLTRMKTEQGAMTLKVSRM